MQEGNTTYKEVTVGHHHPWWQGIAHFLGHTVAGTAIFMIVAIPAVALSYVIGILRGWGVPEFTLTILTYLEHIILIVDGLLFVSYLLITGWRALQEI